MQELPTGLDIVDAGFGCADRGCGCSLLVVGVLFAFGILMVALQGCTNWAFTHTGSASSKPKASTPTGVPTGVADNDNSGIFGTWHDKSDPSKTITFSAPNKVTQHPAGSFDSIPDEAEWMWMPGSLTITNGHYSATSPLRKKYLADYRGAYNPFFNHAQRTSSGGLVLTEAIGERTVTYELER